MEQENLGGGMSSSELKQLKSQGKKIYSISINDGDKDYKGWFTKPKLIDLQAATKIGKDDPFKATMILFESCWIKGDQELKDNDDFKLAAISKFQDILKVRDAEIKEW